ncbi:hypothetical protein BGZ61DRAFT_468434 [Ilyonectria robusta]|uniref:uncharacterized protein n=1 Tax=Ilyonectria robusta TaxID=1079257 RepID=UPI001E8E0C39|nr:uncharacterized protein BGZ61DRAFT_468434 [Ilyonectria robusta]KAH8652835.1 hypothetical protein BGZ61DRAFT_468434 [Ilyonectria robusta]
MNQTVNDWPSDDASDSQNCDLSTSDSEASQHATSAPRSRLRPAGSVLAFMPFADWEPERSYEGEPTIRYNVEWKLSVKNREQAGESELDIVISPHKFWKHVLRPKVTVASANKPWKEVETKLVLSVTDRKTANIRKRFSKLVVDWLFVEKQLQEWSKFLNDGKRITITVTFYYQCVDTGKPGRGGATANQEAELEARTAGLGRGACIRKAYTLMRCPGPPCTKGDHCWQNGGNHYQLQPHHVRMLADHLQSGKVLNGHDDVPDNFRRLVLDDERERQEREQKEREKQREKEQRRKRRRRDSDGSSVSITAVHCHRCATGDLDTPKMVFPTSPLLEFDLSREDAVTAYSVWQRSQVSTEEQKESYDSAQELTLAHCFDLDMLASNQERMYRFYKKHGIPEGVVWRYVCDVRSWVKQRERAKST